MLNKSKKEKIVKEINQALQENTSLVFINFHGMNVADETSLRKELRSKDVGYKVSRKTLLKRALAGLAEGDMPELSGEVAIAYSKDDIASSREVYNFQKTHPSALSILGGIFEGKFISSEKMTELAMIPSKEVLLSKLAFLFQSPIQRFAIALNEVAKLKANGY